MRGFSDSNGFSPGCLELSVLENCRIDLRDVPRRQLGFSSCSDGFLCTLKGRSLDQQRPLGKCRFYLGKILVGCLHIPSCRRDGRHSCIPWSCLEKRLPPKGFLLRIFRLCSSPGHWRRLIYLSSSHSILAADHLAGLFAVTCL